MNDQTMQRFLYAIPAVGVLVLCARFGGGFTGFGALLAGLRLIGVAALVVAGLVLAARLSGRSAGHGGVAHVHGGQREDIARHEAGHAVAARAVGGRVTSARIYSGDRGGLVQTRLPQGPLPAVTFLIAGQIAAGTTTGAGADNAAIRRELRGMSGGDARRVRTQATRDATRILARRSSEVDRNTDTLIRKGHL
jgi:hypothetical protein